jgi:hypothetical protein
MILLEGRDAALRRPRTAQRAVPTKRRILVVFLLLLVARHALATEENQTGFRVVKEVNGDTTTLIMKCDYATEFTVTFEATLQNVTPSRPVP